MPRTIVDYSRDCGCTCVRQGSRIVLLETCERCLEPIDCNNLPVEVDNAQEKGRVREGRRRVGNQLDIFPP